MVNHQLTKFIGGTALGMSRLWAQPTDSLTYAFVLLLCSSLDFSNCLSFSCGLLARMPPTIPVIIALLVCLLHTEWLHTLVKWPELYEFSLKSLGPHNSWKNVKEEKKEKKLSYGEGSKSSFSAIADFLLPSVPLTLSTHHITFNTQGAAVNLPWDENWAR